MTNPDCPEFRHLRKMQREALERVQEAHRNLDAIDYAIRQARLIAADGDDVDDLGGE